MWSLCHSPLSMHVRIRWTAASIAVLALPVAERAPAQPYYFTPRAEVGAEYHTNRELVTDPALEDAMVEYRGLFQAQMGRRTQRSQAEFRPKVVLQEFPDRSGIDPVELFLDLDYAFHSLRHDFSFLARYARQDSFNAEYGDANFDPFDPNPGASDTGITYIGDTLSESDIIIRIVNGGVNMPAYGNSINPNELTQLTAFLQSRKRPMPADLKTTHR